MDYLTDYMADEPEYDGLDVEDSSEPDSREICQCPYCFCSVRTRYGICDMCYQGAHQG